MRIVVTADLHGNLPHIPKCDLLLIGGDVCPVWDHDPSTQAMWLRRRFAPWLRSLPAEEIVGIAGNHDFVAVKYPGSVVHLPWRYLNNETIDVDGLRIFGSPLSPYFTPGWVFMPPDRELAATWDLIPEDVDILLVHGPPKGIQDKTIPLFEHMKSQHAGSGSLRNKLIYNSYPQLKIVAFGHIHEGYGQQVVQGVRYINASYVNEAYQPGQEPIVIDI